MSKRTRSQLTLQDFGIRYIGRSPHKDARRSHKKALADRPGPASKSQLASTPSPSPQHNRDQSKRSSSATPCMTRTTYALSECDPNTDTARFRRARSVPPDHSTKHANDSQTKSTTTVMFSGHYVSRSRPLKALNSGENLSTKDNKFTHAISRPVSAAPRVLLEPTTPGPARSPIPPLSPLTPLPPTPFSHHQLSSPVPAPPPDPSEATNSSLSTSAVPSDGAQPAMSLQPKTPTASASRLPRPFYTLSSQAARQDPEEGPSSKPPAAIDGGSTTSNGDQTQKKPARATARRGRSTTRPPIPLGGRMTRSASLRHQEIKKREEVQVAAVAAGKASGRAAEVSDPATLSSTAPTLARVPATSAMPVPSTSLSSSSSGASTSASTSAVTSTPHASRTSTSTVPQKRPMACSFAQPTASSVLKSTPAASSPKKARLAPAESQRPKSSLSTLSVALSKLAMPPPPRPSSAMDFNITRDADAPVAGPSNATNSHMSSQPHSGTNGMPARKAATTGNLVAMLGRRPDGPGVKKTLSMRTLTRGGPSTLGLGPFGRGAFASRGRMGLRASKQTTLPMVLGSPVKPGREDAPEDVPADAHDSDTGPQLPAVFAAAVSETDGAESNPTDDAQILADFNDSDVPSHPQLAGASQDAASDARRAAHHARSSRRASLASQLLSQSIAGHPHTPPTLPPGPMTSSGGAKENAVLAADGLPNGAQSAPAALTRTRGAAARVSAHGRSAEASPAQGAGDSGTGPLTVLSDCTIFVDVRTDDGDDAGSLFVDMLRGMGAKVLQRVGQTCTHIVYKNGLMSTITRYRLLHEPRPLVVGIAWVVECAEQRTHVDETKFLITLDGVNVAGTNKRRRSMLPKSLGVDPEATGTPPQQSYSPAERSTEHVGAADVFSSQVPADVTMEESREGAADVGLDSLPPLEKARRRKSLLFGPHAMHH